MDATAGTVMKVDAGTRWTCAGQLRMRRPPGRLKQSLCLQPRVRQPLFGGEAAGVTHQA